MLLVSIIAFMFWKILPNFVFMKGLCLAIIADESSIWKSVQCHITFMFVLLTETTNCLVYNCLLLEMKKLLISWKRVFIENKAALQCQNVLVQQQLSFSAKHFLYKYHSRFLWPHHIKFK